MKTKLRGLIPVLVLGALAAVPSFGTNIKLGISGNTEVGGNFINFATSLACSGGPGTSNPCSYASYPNAGVFLVTSPVDIPFSTEGVASGEMGKITSLNAGVVPVGTTLATPLKFLTFDTGGSNLQLFLTMLDQGAAPGNPFTLTDTARGAVADFSVDGYILNTNTNVQTPYIGVFSATFAGLTVADLINPANLPQYTPYSATFTVTTVPEPASLLLMGVGLLGAGVVARKRFKRD